MNLQEQLEIVRKQLTNENMLKLRVELNIQLSRRKFLEEKCDGIMDRWKDAMILLQEVNDRIKEIEHIII